MASDPLGVALGEIGPDECSSTMPEDDYPPYDAAGLFTAPRRIVSRYSLPYTRDRVEALVRSMSVSILAEPDEREQMISRIRAAMPDGTFDLSWVCEAWTATRLPAQ